MDLAWYQAVYGCFMDCMHWIHSVMTWMAVIGGVRRQDGEGSSVRDRTLDYAVWSPGCGRGQLRLPPRSVLCAARQPFKNKGGIRRGGDGDIVQRESWIGSEQNPRESRSSLASWWRSSTGSDMHIGMDSIYLGSCCCGGVLRFCATTRTSRCHHLCDILWIYVSLRIPPCRHVSVVDR